MNNGKKLFWWFAGGTAEKHGNLTGKVDSVLHGMPLCAVQTKVQENQVISTYNIDVWIISRMDGQIGAAFLIWDLRMKHTGL